MRKRWLFLVVPVCIVGILFIEAYVSEQSRSAEIEAENVRQMELAETRAMLAEIEAELSVIELQLLEIENPNETIEDLAEMDANMALIVKKVGLTSIAEIEADLAKIEADLAKIVVERAEPKEIAEIEAKLESLKISVKLAIASVEANAIRAEMVRQDAMLEAMAFDDEGVYFVKGVSDGAKLSTATLKEIIEWFGYTTYAYDYDCEPLISYYEREFYAAWIQYVRGVDEGIGTVPTLSFIDRNDWADEGKLQATSCARDASDLRPFLRAHTSFYD